MLTQFHFIPNENNKFTDIRTYCSTSRLDWLWWNLVNTWPFIISHLFKRYVNLKGSTSISGPAICTSVSLRTLTPHKFNSWQKWLLHLLKILWKPAPRSPSASFTYVALSWKPFFNRFTLLHKHRCSYSYHVPRSLIGPFRYSSFSFLKCLLASYLTLFQSFIKMWLIYCNHCNLVVSFDLELLNILHLTMVYFISTLVIYIYKSWLISTYWYQSSCEACHENVMAQLVLCSSWNCWLHQQTSAVALLSGPQTLVYVSAWSVLWVEAVRIRIFSTTSDTLILLRTIFIVGMIQYNTQHFLNPSII